MFLNGDGNLGNVRILMVDVRIVLNDRIGGSDGFEPTVISVTGFKCSFYRKLV